MEQKINKGTFYIVGIGPGDPELITLKAVKILNLCPVIAAPRTKSGETLALDICSSAIDMSSKTLEFLDFSMSRDQTVRIEAHKIAAEKIMQYLDKGLDVAMPNLGDVSIYATGSYMLEILKNAGYKTEMIPGVPSFCAVAAKLNTSLTEIDTPLHIAPGSGDIADLIKLHGTKVLMKSGKQLPHVLSQLNEAGLLHKSMLVKNCGLDDEEVYEDLGVSSPAEDAGYFVTLIVKE